MIHQMDIMLKAARMHSSQVQHRSPTTARLLSMSAGLQAPTVLRKATLQHQIPRR